MKKLPETFFCETHGYMHKKGSKTYDTCIDSYLEIKEEVEEEEAEEPISEESKPTKTVLVEVEPETEAEEAEESEPVSIESEGLHLSSFATVKDNELVCRLVKDAPDTVTYKSAMYASGQRVFKRKNEPFIVTNIEYRTVLNRGVVYFELL